MKEPALLVVGATKLKSAFPNVFVISEKLVIVGVVLFMVRVAVIVPAK